MKLTNLKRLTATAAFGLVAMLGATQVSNAQWTNREWQREQRRIEKQQRQAQKEQRRYERRMYRVYNNGNYYQTDDRGIQILRDAVNRGYQQGYYAGQTGRRSRNSNYYNLSALDLIIEPYL